MSVRLAPGLCQPITPSLFRACVREWAVCSGLTDCFSVVGTLITAPTLSQASASLPPSFFFFLLPLCAAAGSKRALRWSVMERGRGRTRLESAQRDETTQIWERGRWGTYERLRAASVSGFVAGEQTCDHAQSWTSLSRDWTVAPVRPRRSGAYNLRRTPEREREAAFIVMYCTAQCAAAGEGGRSGIKARESLREGERKGTHGEREEERRHNECVKISPAHPEKNSSMCY